MHSLLLNLSLYFQLLGRVAVMTGIGPGIVILGLYNFQKRFVPKILAGEKTHTIRSVRAHPDKPGNLMHLFTGLRTKAATLLMRVPCVKVEEISISLAPENFLDDDAECVFVSIDGLVLHRSECEALARRDGFESFDEMLTFWDGRLPFRGHIIHWRKSA